MYDLIFNTVKTFTTQNNITEIVVGSKTWNELQALLISKIGNVVNNSEFWGDVFLDILYDLNIEVSYND